MKIYECPSCNHKFSDAHENWKGIVFLEYCPNPNCGMPLPNGTLPEFRCQNCGKTKPVSEVGSINLLTKFILAFATPRMRKVCAECSPQVNFFGWFILSLFALFLGAYLYAKFTT